VNLLFDQIDPVTVCIRVGMAVLVIDGVLLVSATAAAARALWTTARNRLARSGHDHAVTA
jgi:hypothetical protein